MFRRPGVSRIGFHRAEFHRAMAFAGSWYPATAEECLVQMRGWERDLGTKRDAHSAPLTPSRTRCCIAPHAGWMYSGRLALQSVRSIASPTPAARGEPVRLVVLLGGHLHRDDPVIAMSEGEWETPFGVFPIHEGFDSALDGLTDVRRETEARHEADNSIEVLLPFAKHAFPDAELLPLRVPPSGVALELGARLAKYLAASNFSSVAIASTDLTHYGPNYGFEPRGRGPAAERWVRDENDPLFIKAVEGGSGQTILDTARRQRNACCPGAVAALNEIARGGESAHGVSPTFRTLGYGTSLDTSRNPGAEPSSSFVGYLAGVYV